MTTTSTIPKVRQLDMPGMPEPIRMEGIASSASVIPGQQVLYLGSLRGGPRQGARGTVRSLQRRSALVDMGAHGIWHVPYFLLALREAA